MLRYRWLPIILLFLTGCAGAPTRPQIIQGVAVNTTQETLTLIKINGTTVSANLAPGESCDFDLGIGSSVFYTTNASGSFQRSFSANLRATGTVSIGPYQRYGCIWLIGQKFVDPSGGERSG